jgi:hypothetical protein
VPQLLASRSLTPFLIGLGDCESVTLLAEKFIRQRVLRILRGEVGVTVHSPLAAASVRTVWSARRRQKSSKNSML